MKRRVLDSTLGVVLFGILLVSVFIQLIALDFPIDKPMINDTLASKPENNQLYITSALWWNSSWLMRNQINITNTINHLSDYQIKITLNSTNFNYSHAQADGSDIRFVSDDGLSELSFWIEKWNSIGTSTIWVKIPLIAALGTTTIYMYYNNLDAATASNGVNTFYYFEDFENQTVGSEPIDWTIEDNQYGNFEISGDTVSGTKCGHFVDTSSSGTPIVHTTFGMDIVYTILEFWVKPEISYDSGIIYYNDYISSWKGGNIYFGFQSTSRISYYDTSYHSIYSPYTSGSWYFIRVMFDNPTTYKQTVYDFQKNLLAEVQNCDTIGTPTKIDYFRFGGSSIEHMELYIDGLRVRNYTSIEPTINIGLMEQNGPDTDNDFLTDEEEIIYGTNATNPDTDFDSLLDGYEVKLYGTNPLSNDTDLDGLLDGDEFNVFLTNPLNNDSDSDSISDYDEIIIYSTDPNKEDSDNDSLTDGEEILGIYAPTNPGANGTGYVHTNPLLIDSDSDLYNDNIEIDNDSDPNNASSYPANIDSDGDGLLDSEEFMLGTDPFDSDTDNDGIQDGTEVNTYNTDPLDSDTDGDSLDDYAEIFTHHTNPLNVDTDSDGLNDYSEVITYNTNPSATDTDYDGLDDYDEVITYRTDPLNSDTDNDGLDDWEEVEVYFTNPKSSDSDSDGLSDSLELTIGTDPNNQDTDFDGKSDFWEYTHGTDPLRKYELEKIFGRYLLPFYTVPPIILIIVFSTRAARKSRQERRVKEKISEVMDSGYSFNFEDVEEEVKQEGLFDTKEPELSAEEIAETPKSKPAPKPKTSKKRTKKTQPSTDEELPFGITQMTTAFVNGRPVRIQKALVMTKNGMKWKITNLETNETWYEDQ